MTRLECFFDCSSPYTYLAFENLQSLAADFDAQIEWRPILVGAVFNAINPNVEERRAATPVPAKLAYVKKDFDDWARFTGITFRNPRGGDRWQPSVFPVNSAKAMRGCIAAEAEGKLVPFARAVFQIYWSEDQDISQEPVLAEVCRRAGVDQDRVLAGIADPALKARLRANTDELMHRGGFGSPTIFLDGSDLYFGNDRLPLVRFALEQRRAGPDVATKYAAAAGG